MKILLFVVLILCQTTAFAQTKKFRWTDSVCNYESTYDAKKYTAEQLKDTSMLLSLGYFPNTIDPVPDNYADIKKLNVATLDEEYLTRTNELKQLNTVKTKYWETLRQRHLKEIEQVYQLSRASILGYENPSRLRDVAFADVCVSKYIAPLTDGGDSLLALWLEVNEVMRSKNSSPDRIKTIYEREFNSPEKFQYARVTVMQFGWWNCVNGLIDRDDKYEENEREFRKLFKRTRTIECDEP